MIRGGALCKSCSGGKCQDIGIKLACPNCNELGCDKCNQTGYFELNTCPQQEITRDAKEVMKYSEWMERGFLPVSGGLLDQSASLLAHCGFYADEKNRVEAERYK